MDFKNRHPLNAIDGYESLSMLEALIPFVEYPLKLPLALFIKFNEIRLIIKCFQSNSNLVRLGLHNPCNDTLDMICSLTGMSPDMMKMMFSMMNGNNNSMFSDLFNGATNSNPHEGTGDVFHSNPFAGFSAADISNAMSMFQSMQSGFGNASNDTTSPNPNPESDNNFEENIQNILAEYDLAQAEKYDTQNNYSD